MDLANRIYMKIKLFVTKFRSKSLEEKIVHTGCSAIILLLFPFFAKSYASLFIGVTYAAFVLPTFISANSKYPPTPLKHLMNPLSDWGKSVMICFKHLFLNLYSPISKAELTLFSMPNMFTMICQLSFFTCCDHILLLKEKKTLSSSLYTLIFYNVLTYCFSYIQEIIEKKSWCLAINISNTSNVKHLSMTVTNIILEWTKAVTFIITLIFLMLIFTLEQSLNQYFPTKFYILITFIYYILLEKFYMNYFYKLFIKLDLSYFDQLEELYCPIILKLITILLSNIILINLIYQKYYKFTFILIYINIYLMSKYINLYLTPKLSKEINILNCYRYVTKDELLYWNDICPICLNSMIDITKSRITPCLHIFHSSCLRQYIKIVQKNVLNITCPLCKKFI